MKYKKLRFLSVVCVVSLLISQGAIAAYSVGDNDPDPTSGYSESEITHITIDDIVVEVDEKEYDGNTTANATVTINPDLLNGKNVTVKYTAAEFDNEKAGEKKDVTISGLYLDGDDKDAFSLDIEEKTVNNGVITQRIVELTPNDTQLHYTSDVYPKSGIPVIYDSTKIFDNGVSGSIPKTVFIVYNDDNDEKYFYSLEKNKLETEKVLTNANYKVQIATSKKPIVNIPTSPSILPAIFDSSASITYDDELGFITKDDVSIILRAQPGIPDNNDVKNFYVISDRNAKVQPLPASKDDYNNEYKSGSVKLPTDDGTVRTVEIKCSLVEGTEPSTPIQFSNGSVDSYKLMIDKAAPTLYSADKLTLTYNDRIQKIGVSGGFVDNGTGIKSIEYKIGDNTYRPLEISGNGNKTSPFVFKTGEDNVYYIADYNDFTPEQVKKGTCEITFRVTDNVGNQYITNKNSFNVDNGGTIAEPTIESIILKDENNPQSVLDDLLHILTFGIYTNLNLTLDIKAASDNFSSNHVEKSGVSVSLIDKGEDGNFESVYKDSPDETLEDGTLRFLLGNDDKIVNRLYVKVTNEYERTFTISLREALDNAGQWNTTKTTDSDKWVFDKTLPQISLSLDSRTKPEDMDENDDFNPRAISKDYDQFEIVASDSSGIESFEVYNKNDDTYTILDKNKNEYFIVDDKGNEYSIIKLIENGFIISDGVNNIEVSIKKETITVDNPDDPDNPDTKDIYSIVDKNRTSFFFTDEDTEYTLESVKGERNYVIKNNDITTEIDINEVHNLYAISGQNNQPIDSIPITSTFRLLKEKTFLLQLQKIMQGIHQQLSIQSMY